MAKPKADPVIKRAKEAFDKSGKSLDEIGAKMGCPSDTARQYVWQLLNRVPDPRISTLRKFAKAVGVELEDLVKK